MAYDDVNSLFSAAILEAGKKVILQEVGYPCGMETYRISNHHYINRRSASIPI